MYVSRHLYNFSLNSRRCLEQTCYKCFFDSFRFFQIVYTRLCLFMGKRKGVEVYKQEGRNLSFVEVSSFKHGIFPISIIAYNTLILSYFHITRCCSISKDTNFSANHNTISRALGHATVLFNKQRYEFFSKSQRVHVQPAVVIRCCSISKDTNFSANHN